MYQWIIFLHVLGSFGFMMAHGASAVVAFKLRGERNLDRVRALLDLSVSSYGVMYISLLVLLVAGITAGFVGHWWRMGWIWTAIGLLLATLVAMSLIGSNYYHRIRKAVGLPFLDGSKQHPPVEPASTAEIDALLASSRPEVLTVIGALGFALIVWLMFFKPF